MGEISKSKTWWKEFIKICLATTISIVFTFGTAALVDSCKRVKDRKMTALMVMSNIEDYARSLENMAKVMARKDTVAAWLLSLPEEDVKKADPAYFSEPIREVIFLQVLSHDKTAESIFSSNMDTWKNMGNFRFIDNVGDCFSNMNWLEDYWNRQVEDAETMFLRVQKEAEQNSDHLINRLLKDHEMRMYLNRLHSMAVWFEGNAITYRQMNRINMQLMNISEKEVMDFTDQMKDKMDLEVDEDPYKNLERGLLNPDSLETMKPYKQMLDSLLQR
ncbi:MAG: hypothetical protein J6T04_00435 [Bacteroidales bacterium]|nr:hypothetical protein [Bacteroidales bacterium]